MYKTKLYKQIHGCMQNIDFNIEYFNELMHIKIVFFSVKNYGEKISERLHEG